MIARTIARRCGWASLAMLPLALHAQVTVDYDLVRQSNPVPNEAAVNDALERLRPERERALSAPPARPMNMPAPAKAPDIPDVRAKPMRIDALPGKIGVPTPTMTTARPSLDIGQIARAYESVARPSGMDKDVDFRVFVSFSIPANDLRAMIEGAADAGATVVFRGPADEGDMGLQRFAAKLKAVGVTRAGEIQIDPPSFTKFRVGRVPAYVLSQRAASAKEIDGCAPPGAYAAVAGTMAPEYALNVIKSGAKGELAQAAERRLAALKAQR